MIIMKCQKCGERESTTHIKRIMNGKAEEYYLCADCAAQLGYGKMFTAMPFHLENMLGNFLSDSNIMNHVPVQEERCKICGCSFRDIVSTGKVGCANCYTIFYDKLLPSLQRIHGKTKHVGKIPSSEGSKAKIRRELEDMKRQLNAAVEEQNFEEAARLRDEIKRMESEVQE